MTPAQRTLYFRTWATAAKAHEWNTQAGILDALRRHHAGEVWQSPELTRTLAAILDLALTTAASEDRDVTADDLRHACTIVAVGHNQSSKRFTNSDFDKVLALLRLLADPTNLRNLVAAQHPGESGERRRLMHHITSAPPPYWQRLARDKFGHTDLDRLTLSQLRQISLTLRHRQPGAPASQPARHPSPTIHAPQPELVPA
jgi:hypothetical protein